MHDCHQSSGLVAELCAMPVYPEDRLGHLAAGVTAQTRFYWRHRQHSLILSEFWIKGDHPAVAAWCRGGVAPWQCGAVAVWCCARLLRA